MLCLYHLTISCRIDFNSISLCTGLRFLDFLQRCSILHPIHISYVQRDPILDSSIFHRHLHRSGPLWKRVDLNSKVSKEVLTVHKSVFPDVYRQLSVIDSATSINGSEVPQIQHLL